jgi:phosphate transport system ATP-binding protein
MAKRIDVEDVNVFYGDFLAVEDASINVAPLSVTAFIGPSGCG